MFLDLSNQVIGMPEEELVFIFIEELKEETKCSVLTKGVNTIEDAVKQATIFEECNSRQNVNFVKKVNYSKI
jgi:hypothetical protein